MTIPASALRKLQAYRKQQPCREHFGDSYQGDYNFCNPDGSPLKSDTVSASVSLLFRSLKLPKGASLHTLTPNAPFALAGGRRSTDRYQQAARACEPACQGDGLCPCAAGAG